ncbi:MAG: XRE family transcriptional regulator [Candidatus Thiodiazotropha sp. (ex Lucinoma kastoroae)]|nr:XRE family transcriptional regulator [Candidatus Thiodiazotropha sp. (ex Lucinoma kastoroae)]
MKYTPPTPENLRAIRDDLGLTQSSMADFVNVAGGQQWRKYTGGQSPRHMSFHMLFFLAARLSMNDSNLNKVYKKMIDLGATIERD